MRTQHGPFFGVIFCRGPNFLSTTVKELLFGEKKVDYFTLFLFVYH